MVSKSIECKSIVHALKSITAIYTHFFFFFPFVFYINLIICYHKIKSQFPFVLCCRRSTCLSLSRLSQLATLSSSPSFPLVLRFLTPQLTFLFLPISPYQSHFLPCLPACHLLTVYKTFLFFRQSLCYHSCYLLHIHHNHNHNHYTVVDNSCQFSFLFR